MAKVVGRYIATIEMGICFDTEDPEAIGFEECKQYIDDGRLDRAIADFVADEYGNLGSVNVNRLYSIMWMPKELTEATE